MQINRFSDYALRVLMYAVARGERELCTVDELAGCYDISRHHLVKVVHGLQGLGYLKTRRGRGGGFQLAVAPETVRIGELLRDTEGTLALVECFDPARNQCRLTPACRLKGALGEALEAFFAALDRYTLADLVAEPAPVRIALGLAEDRA